MKQSIWRESIGERDGFGPPLPVSSELSEDFSGQSVFRAFRNVDAEQSVKPEFGVLTKRDISVALGESRAFQTTYGIGYWEADSLLELVRRNPNVLLNEVDEITNFFSINRVDFHDVETELRPTAGSFWLAWLVLLFQHCPSNSTSVDACIEATLRLASCGYHIDELVPYFVAGVSDIDVAILACAEGMPVDFATSAVGGSR